jgi:hypothetical protein
MVLRSSSSSSSSGGGGGGSSCRVNTAKLRFKLRVSLL